MKRTGLTLTVVGLALLFAAPARAVSSKEFNCEKQVVVGLAQFSRARGKCITTCVTKKQTQPNTYDCSPPFDPNGTQACADKSVETYGKILTAKCTGNMPACGGFQKGYCSNNPSATCDRNVDCGHCNVTTGTFCTTAAQCPLGESCQVLGQTCGGRCSVTQSQACDVEADCPPAEDCVTSSIPKDIPDFITGNLFDGSPIGAAGQIDQFSETLFQCRQSVCSGSGFLCGSDTDCAMAESCRAGKCKAPATNFCTYDGDCSTKKCLPLGACALAAQSCTADADCGANGPCQRWGRCNGGSNNLEPCFSIADCPDAGGTCTRTATDLDRKVEQGCSKAAADALAKLTFDISNCQAKCALERDLKLGQRCAVDPTIKCKTDPDCPSGACRNTSCDPTAIGRCANDVNQVCAGNADCLSVGGACNDTTPDPISGALKACRDLSLSKALASINKKCPSLPLCGAFAPLGGAISNLARPQDLLGFVSALQDGQFKEDNPDLSPGSNFCEQ